MTGTLEHVNEYRPLEISYEIDRPGSVEASTIDQAGPKAFT